MNIKDLKIGDFVKFQFKDYLLVGTVRYITDYGTINVAPYAVDFIYSIRTSDVLDFIEGKLVPALLDEELIRFLFGVHLISYDTLNKGLVYIVYIPIEDGNYLQVH